MRRAWPATMLWIYCVVLIGLTGVVFAGEPLSIRATADVDRIRVGDPITLTIKVECPQDTRVIFPGDDIDLSPFSILGRSQSAGESKSGTNEESLVLSISAYQTGDLTIPAINVTCESTDHAQTTLTTEPLPVTVASVLTQPDEQPRAIKDPLAYEASWVYKVLVIGSAIVVVALCTVLILWIRRRRQARARIIAETPPAPRPIDELALEELEQLRSEDLPGRGLIKEYYVRLTDTFKRYLAGRFAISTLERTTGEIRRDIADSNLAEIDRREINQVLEQADLVKFAKFQPPKHIVFDIFNQVESFILRTRDTRISLSTPDSQSASPSLPPASPDVPTTLDGKVTGGAS